MGSEEDHEGREKKEEGGEKRRCHGVGEFENMALRTGQLELRAAQIENGKLQIRVIDREVT